MVNFPQLSKGNSICNFLFDFECTRPFLKKKSSSLKGNKLLRRGEKYFLLEKTRVFVICTKKLCILGYPKCAQWRFWSDCANAQAHLKLRLAHMSKGTSSHVAIHLIGFAKCEAAYEAGHNDHTLFKYSSSVQPHTIATHGNECMNGSGCSCMEVAVGYKEVYCIVKLRLMIG